MKKLKQYKGWGIFTNNEKEIHEYGFEITALHPENMKHAYMCKPYVDADTIGEYGIVKKIWCDRRYQIEENLYQAAKAKLERLKRPRVTYEIDAVELWAISEIPIDKFDEGDVIRVIDEDTNIDVTTRIVKKSKSGIESDYITTTVVVSSDGEASTNGLTDLMERTKINETNAQGATNINNYTFRDNCDPEHPARIRFRIPEAAVNINLVELSFEAGAFRAYSKANVGAPSTTSGASSETTSGQSSVTSSGASSSTTTGQSSETSSGSSSSTTTGQSSETSSGSSSSTTTGQSSKTSSGSSTSTTTSSGTSNVSIAGMQISSGQGNTYNYDTNNALQGTEFEHSHGSPDHEHFFVDSGHNHNMAHTHSIEHEHNMEHTHNIAHTHNIDHTHSIAHSDFKCVSVLRYKCGVRAIGRGYIK